MEEESKPPEETLKETKKPNKVLEKIIKYKKLLITSAVVLILIAGLMISSYNPKTTKQAAPTPTPQDVKEPVSNKNLPYNPLISNYEIKRVEEAYKKKFEKAGKPLPAKKNYNFQYELSPLLKEKNSSFIQSSFAASSCNLETAPKTLNIYTLKFHLFEKEARVIAKKFGLDFPPSSLPMNDGSSFQYYYSDPKALAFLSISEPSGAFIYHKATESSTLTDIDISKAREIADSQIIKHGLTKISFKNQKFDTASGKYVIDYTKDYDGMKVVDLKSLSLLGKTKTLCDVSASSSMSYVEEIITKKGAIFKIINKTRKEENTFSAPRQSLEDSIKEYENDPPVPPLVIGDAKTNEKAVIDEAVLVWYDYGEEYAQVSYVPMYLTSGKTALGARVLTLFPAVSKENLDKTDITILGAGKSTQSLQLDTFKPKPPPPKGEPPAPGGICPGGLVDYLVTCSSSEPGLSCTESLESPVDTVGACTNGCQTTTVTFVAEPGVNPCNAAVNGGGTPPGAILDQDQKGGTVTCTIQGCPC